MSSELPLYRYKVNRKKKREEVVCKILQLFSVIRAELMSSGPIGEFLRKLGKFVHEQDAYMRNPPWLQGVGSNFSLPCALFNSTCAGKDTHLDGSRISLTERIYGNFS